MANKNSFAGRIGSKGRGEINNPDLAVNIEDLNPKPKETEQTKPAKSTNRFVQENRKGKQIIGGYFDKSVKKQFAMLGLEIEKNQTELITEALNDLFHKYKKPPIA